MTVDIGSTSTGAPRFCSIVVSLFFFIAAGSSKTFCQFLSISLKVDQRTYKQETHPVAVIIIENSSEVPVAFSKTFGFGAYWWLGLRINNKNGTYVNYPIEIDIFRPPAYTCLEPGEKLTWNIDLLHWYAVAGGEIAYTEALKFDLSSGRYRMQATYTETSSASSAPCAPVDEEVKSDWVEFQVH